jgi:hypothetical protein
MPLSGAKLWLIEIAIAYDPTTISIDLTKSFSQTTYTIKSQQSGSFVLGFTDVSSIDPHQSLFYVPFSWSSQHILIEDASSTIDNKQGWLAIWKLSPTVNHWK